MRIAVIENTAVTHHGQVGVALHEAGALIDLYRPFAGQPLPAPESFDALVAFGGEQSACDDRLHPYLPGLAALMAGAVRQGQAVLGVCLGAQVLARGLGAENRLGAAPEFGWCEVALTAAGLQDAVLSGAGAARFPIFQWHSDTFTLPPGAGHLAASPVAAVQAFRSGRAGYGMQFHFEASRAVVADWTRRFPAAMDGLEPGWAGALGARSAGPGVAADAAGLGLARAWVALAADPARG